MRAEPAVETTVQAMLRVYGKNAAKEAKRMADRLARRRDSQGGDHWRQVYLILHGSTEPSGTISPTMHSPL
jgi:hypothetical protein